MSSREAWTDVDHYVTNLFGLEDAHLQSTLSHSREGELPEIQVSYPLGQLLHVLAKATGARRVLEVGTLGGFSTQFLARAVRDQGMVYSLELEHVHAEVARENVARAGLEANVEIIEGDALASLERMISEKWDPFDFVFLDADKPGYTSYMKSVMYLSRPGTLIVADNVVRDGEVTNADSDDLMVQGVREFNAFVAAEPRLSATIIQTVGSKGYDGIAVVVVNPL